MSDVAVVIVMLGAIITGFRALRLLDEAMRAPDRGARIRRLILARLAQAVGHFQIVIGVAVVTLAFEQGGQYATVTFALAPMGAGVAMHVGGRFAITRRLPGPLRRRTRA